MSFGDIEKTLKASIFNSKWLSGTTCNRATELFFQQGRYVVLKHKGHTDYVDRVSGSTHCNTYYELHDIDGPASEYEIRYGGKPLKRWNGRWRNDYWAEFHKAIDDYEKETGK